MEPLLVNIPCDDSNQLNGLIDLPSLMYYSYKDDMGQYVDIEQIEKGHRLYERAIHHRQELIEQVSNFDDELADAYLSGIEAHEISPAMLENAISESILS